LTTISTPADSSAAALVGSGPLRSTILAAPEVINDVIRNLDDLFFFLNGFNIPLDPGRTVFEADRTIFVSGGATRIATFKFDFADFDLEGDGETEGCTGSTCPVNGASGACPSETEVSRLRPVCLRVWLDDERFLAGVLDTLASTANAGIGDFIVSDISPVTGRGVTNALLPHAVSYDHQDPNNKSTEVFRSIVNLDPAQTESLAHGLVDEIRDGGRVQKTVNFDARAVSVSPPTSVQYLARFVEAEDFMGLHTLTTGFFDDFLELTPPICAQISSATEAPQGECEDRGTDVNGIPFVDPATDVNLSLPPPSVFPVNPTFR
jgi:hypothetical protein